MFSAGFFFSSSLFVLSLDRSTKQGTLHDRIRQYKKCGWMKYRIGSAARCNVNSESLIVFIHVVRYLFAPSLSIIYFWLSSLFCFFLLSPSAYSTPINYYTSRGERRVGGRKQKKIYWRRGREESGRSGSILYSQKNTTSYGYIYRAIALLGGVIKIYDLPLIIFRLYTYMYVFPIFLSHNAVQANVHYIAIG